MPIEFNCPYCDAHLSLWDELAGKQGTCPKCKKNIVVPNPKGVYAMMACPNCEAEIPANAVICTKCGTDLKTGAKLNTQVNQPGAIQKATEESAEQILGMLWRYRFVVAAIVIFFAAVIWLFSWASKKSIHPGQKLLKDDAAAAR